jgi:hypothetical protein
MSRSNMQVCWDSNFSLILISIFRTNCSNNGTIDNQCWREALKYRSSDLINQLFSFSSLSIYIDTFQQHHPKKVC